MNAVLGITQSLAIIGEVFIKNTPANPIESNETCLLSDAVPIPTLLYSKQPLATREVVRKAV